MPAPFLAGTELAGPAQGETTLELIMLIAIAFCAAMAIFAGDPDD